MTKAVLSMIVGAMLVAGCSSQMYTSKDINMARDALAEADAAVAEVKAAGFEWQLIDRKATGKGSSVAISKLLEIAHTKADEGDLLEAGRIARLVADAAQDGLAQAEVAASAAPYYNN